jgi:beta-N-acetylhexosaminidase
MADVTQRAVIAGNDVLLMPTDVPTAINAVVAGVREGKFTEARIDSSVRKLLVAKHQLGLERQRYVDVEAVRRVVADSANMAAGRLAAERAITLVRSRLAPS